MADKPDSEEFAYRKVQVVGKCSLAVTIPKRWAEKLGLKPGAHVLIRKLGNTIVITPVTSGEKSDQDEHSVKKLEIAISSDNVWRSLRKLVSCYLAGYSEVTIRLIDGAEGLKLIVKEFVRNKLSGTEIIHEDEHTIDVRFLAEGGIIPFRYLLSQMCENVTLILKNAIADIVAQGGKGYLRESRSTIPDDEIDRLYLLTLRQVNMALADENIRVKTGVKNLRELLAIVSVAKSLERCGDHATRVAYLCQNLLAIIGDRSSDLTSLEKLAELSSLTCTVLRNSVHAFITCDTELAQEILDRHRVELRRFSINIISNIVKNVRVTGAGLNDVSTYLVLILESIRRILAYSYDIAEITIDTYSIS